MIKRLRRVREMREAKGTRRIWEVNPKGHPEPYIPTEVVLERYYLPELNRSAKHLIPEANELISFVYKGKERR